MITLQAEDLQEEEDGAAVSAAVSGVKRSGRRRKGRNKTTTTTRKHKLKYSVNTQEIMPEGTAQCEQLSLTHSLTHSLTRFCLSL